MNGLSTKEMIDSCDAQAQLAYQSWNDRRQYEWKFTIGIWTALLLGVGFFSKDARADDLWFAILASVGFGIYLIWLRGLWSANQFDREMQFHYQRQSRALLIDSNHVVAAFPLSDKKDLALPWKEFLLHYSQLTYLATTATLLVVTFLFATGRVASRADERLKAIEDATVASTQSIQASNRQMQELASEVRSVLKVSQIPPDKGKRR